MIVVFSEGTRLRSALAEALHEIYQIREFRLVFCLETIEGAITADLQLLRLAIQRGVEKGTYDFLSCPPVAFSRTLAEYDRFMGRNHPS